MSTPKKAYFTALDSIMLIMCGVLVISAVVNEMQYDTVSTFKSKVDANGQETGDQRRAILGFMTPDDINILSNITTSLGSMGFGVFLTTIIVKSTNGKMPDLFSSAFKISNSVVGLIVAVLLVVSGVVTESLYKEAKTFKPDEEKRAKQNKDGAKTFIALGSVALILITVSLAMKTKSAAGPVYDYLFNKRRSAPAGPSGGIANLRGTAARAGPSGGIANLRGTAARGIASVGDTAAKLRGTSLTGGHDAESVFFTY